MTISDDTTEPPAIAHGGLSALPEAVLALAGPAIIVTLCWLRSPAMLRTGRFWAEDTMFFDHAHGAPTLLAKLAYVYKGHYELFATLSHALASYAKPKLAPLVTGTAGLALEAMLAYLIIYWRRDLGLGLLPALAISALLVVSPCASEHYLNAVNSQWLASAVLFVVIALPERRLAGRVPAAAAAGFVLGLCGVSSCALLPVAVLYALARRSRPHAAAVVGLCVACLIQGVLIVTHPLDSRFLPVSPYVYVVAPFLQVVVKHLMGVDAENNLAAWFRNGPMAWHALSSFVLMPLALLAGIAYRLRREGLSDVGLLLLSFLIVTLFNEVGAIGDRNDMVGAYMMRYFFLPSFIVAFLLARIAPAVSGLAPRHAALALALLVSTVDFFGSTYNASLVMLDHDWPRQVDACRAGPPGSCRVETSPDGFRVDIPGGPR